MQLGYRDDADRVDGRVFADAIAATPNAEGRFEAREDWANDAGPACMANENSGSPNATLVSLPFGPEGLQSYRALRLTRGSSARGSGAICCRGTLC